MSAYDAVLAAERATNADLIHRLRFTGVSAFFALFIILGGILGHANWQGNLAIFTLYWFASLALFVGSRHSQRLANHFSLAIALIDVPIIFVLQWAQFPTSNPGGIAGFNIGIYVLLLLFGAFALERWRIYFTAAMASLFEGSLQYLAGISLGAIAATVIVLGLAAVACAFGSRRLRELLITVASSQKLLAEARNTAILAAAFDSIVSVDDDGHIQEFNPSAERSFGWTRETAIGRPIEQFLLHATQLISRTCQAGVGHSIEAVAKRVEGTTFPVELVIVRVPLAGPASFVIHVRDISARQAAEEERLDLLRREKQARLEAEALAESLRSAVRARDDFLAIAGHELRTPLAAFKLQFETLTRIVRTAPTLTAGEIEERLAKLKRSLGRLEHLIEELLDVTQLTVRRLELEVDEVDLVRVVKETIEQSAEALSAANCHITFSSPSTLHGHWDHLRLTQVVSNLLTNALKYGSGKPIDVSMTAGETACLIISDHGIGIAPPDKERIFVRFQRAVSGHNYSGLGLGLWISKEIVEAHGGTIKVGSVPGEGSTFVVELPLDARRIDEKPCPQLQA